MWLLENETKNIYHSNGKFETSTRDWNYDGDVYTDTVMYLRCIDDCGYESIHKYDMCDYTEISTEKVVEILKAALAEYFQDGFCNGEYYFCDSTEFGQYHFGDYGFLKGGRCIYGTKEDRQNAIQAEIDRIVRLEK